MQVPKSDFPIFLIGETVRINWIHGVITGFRILREERIDRFHVAPKQRYATPTVDMEIRSALNLGSFSIESPVREFFGTACCTATNGRYLSDNGRS